MKETAMPGKTGKVWLVGAGPGDAGLLTLKGERVLREAEIVLYDNLVGRGVLSLIPPGAEALYVGKRAGKHAVPQEKLNGLIAEKAREGKRVVRLKGGDPFLFGRGGEELEELAAQGVPFEVVPGISAAIGVPAWAGIPLTHRDCASQVHIITAHGRAGEDAKDINWRALAEAGGTLVFFMGASSLGRICAGLLGAGMSPATPAAIVEQGATARQRKLVTTLDALASEGEGQAFAPPSLIIVGEVCAYAEKLSWREKLPLAGLRIGVTRPRDRAGELFHTLQDLGAEAVLLPAVATRPIPETPRLREVLEETAARGDAGGADWYVFTSPAGVEAFFEKLRNWRFDVRRLLGAKFAAIGGKTASELEKRGLVVEVVPGKFSGKELGRALAGKFRPGDRAILPRSRIGTDTAVEELVRAGFECIDIPVYDTLREGEGRDAAFLDYLLAGVDLCVFTSGSTVEGFARLFGAERLRGLRAFCIGEETAAKAGSSGAAVWISENATMESLVAAIINARKGGEL